MSIKVISILEDVNDALSPQSNGEISIPLFNRYSKRAELILMDIATGDWKGQQLPEPYTTQKVKDFCAPFIFPFPTNVQDGKIPFPKDYYGFENMVLLGVYGRKKSCTDEEENSEYDVLDDSNTPIELLDGSQFTARCNTYIKLLKPSFKKPIAKIVNNTFEFMPKDLGSIKLEYYRYPKFAEITPTIDTTYNQEIPDPNNSQDYEWDEKARGLLIYFIVDLFANRTSNKAMKEFNNDSKDTRK